MRKTNPSSVLKRILVLALSLVMLIGSTLAENIDIKKYYSDEQDYLFFLNTLSDGRYLFGGVKAPDEGMNINRKWLLCLSTDRTTVSWEYITPEAEPSTALAVQELPDGTIAVVFDMGDEDYAPPEGMRTKIRFFTQDGQVTGKEIDLPGTTLGKKAVDEYSIQTVLYDQYDENILHFVKTDWDGNVIEEKYELESNLTESPI